MSTQTIIQGDCLEIMKTFGDLSFDLVLTDPPYGLGINYDDNNSDKVLSTAWFKEAKRISHALIFTSGVTNMFEYPKPNWVLCWFKPGAISRGTYGFNSWEPILVYGAKPSTREPDVVRVPVGRQLDVGDHPTPKPRKLFEYLVNRFTYEGARILDPFMGSGTTLVAAKYLNRNATGIEISEKYCEIARKRLSQESLFDTRSTTEVTQPLAVTGALEL